MLRLPFVCPSCLVTCKTNPGPQVRYHTQALHRRSLFIAKRAYGNVLNYRTHLRISHDVADPVRKDNYNCRQSRHLCVWSSRTPSGHGDPTGSLPHEAGPAQAARETKTGLRPEYVRQARAQRAGPSVQQTGRGATGGKDTRPWDLSRLTQGL